MPKDLPKISQVSFRWLGIVSMLPTNTKYLYEYSLNAYII